MLSRIDRNVEFASSRGPPSRIIRPSAGATADFGPAASSSHAHTRATHEQTSLSRARAHMYVRMYVRTSAAGADTRRGTVRFEHFRVVRLMNRLLFLRVPPPSASRPLFPLARVCLVIATTDRSRAPINRIRAYLSLLSIHPIKLHGLYSPSPFDNAVLSLLFLSFFLSFSSSVIRG